MRFAILAMSDTGRKWKTTTRVSRDARTYNNICIHTHTHAHPRNCQLLGDLKELLHILHVKLWLCETKTIWKTGVKSKSRRSRPLPFLHKPQTIALCGAVWVLIWVKEVVNINEVHLWTRLQSLFIVHWSTVQEQRLEIHHTYTRQISLHCTMKCESSLIKQEPLAPVLVLPMCIVVHFTSYGVSYCKIKACIVVALVTTAEK